MNKEELKRLLDSIETEKIESFKISYRKEKSYGYYCENNQLHTITYNQ